MFILSFDLGTTTGWAVLTPTGERVQSRAVDGWHGAR